MPAATLEVTRVLAVLRDAADARTEFARLATVCGWGRVDVERLEVTDSSVDAADVATARRFHATIRSVIWASCDDDRIEAFAGPALVPNGNPLLALDDRVDRVHFAGTCCTAGAAPTATATVGLARSVATPSTDWLVRMQFPGVAPHSDSVAALLAAADLHTVAATAERGTHWCRIAAAPRARVDRAIAELRTRHRITLLAIRAL